MSTSGRSSPTHGTQRTIGVISQQLGGFYFGGLVAGITRVARRSGHQVVAVQTLPTRLGRERHPYEPLPGAPCAIGAVAGVIIINPALPADELARVHEWGYPVVMIGSQKDAPSAPLVLSDNAAGARMAVEHLLGHGHTRIGFIGNLAQPDIQERFDGYRSALSDHNILVEPEWLIKTVGNHAQSGADAASRFLAAGAPTTATLAATDTNAIGFMQALRASEFTLPRDHAVIGFDHTETGARLVPRLSTVDPRFGQVGETAMEVLLSQFRGDMSVARVHRVPTAFVARESCGCSETSIINDTRTGPSSRATSVDCATNALATGVGCAVAPGKCAGQDESTCTPGRARLRRVVMTAFAGSVGTATSPTTDDQRRTGWFRSIVGPLDSAAERGALPSPVALSLLTDLTAALHPDPEAIEQSIGATRAIELELGARLAPGSARLTTLQKATTTLLVAISRGCIRPRLQRIGRLERTIADQYEADMDLLSDKAESPRLLTWLPRTARGPACFGMWVGRDSASGERQIEIAGVHSGSGALTRLVGQRMPASQFPPPALIRAKVRGDSVTFAIPVTSATSDWGLLAINGNVESQMTDSRDKYHHWAALLAVALDREQLVANLQEQGRAFEQIAVQERAHADDLRAREERHALSLLAVGQGIWDWDVSAGSVYYSQQWKDTLGYTDDQIGPSPTEWLGRVHPDDHNELSSLIAAQLGGARGALMCEHRVRTSSGAYRWMLCRAVTVLDSAGRPSRLVGMLIDLSSRSERELASSHTVLRDPQTGLANRVLFLERVAFAIDRAHRSPTFDAALVLLRRGDMDPGGTCSDVDLDARALGEMTMRLELALREGDCAARLGENQFAVLLDDTGHIKSHERIARLLANLHSGEGGLVVTGALKSIRPFHEAEEALQAAGVTMPRPVTDHTAAPTPMHPTPPVKTLEVAPAHTHSETHRQTPAHVGDSRGRSRVPQPRAG